MKELFLKGILTVLLLGAMPAAMAEERARTAVPDRAQETRQQWAVGQESLITRNYPEAIIAFQNVLSNQPNHVQALNGLALALYSQGYYEKALQTIEKALSLDPVNNRLYHTKGQILDAQDKSLEALEAYLVFTALNPDDTAALAVSRRVDDLYKISEAKLNPAWENYLQGLHLMTLHEPEQAIPLFEKYRSLDPASRRADLLIGQAYLQSGQPDKAIPAFEAVLRQSTDNPVAYYQLGESYQLKGDSGNATEAFRKFIQVAPQSEAALQLNQRVGGQPTQTR